MTDLYAVIGWPVAHSLSPAMMNAAFRARSMEAVYVALEVRSDSLEAAVQGIRALGIAGANVTLPHKEACAPICDELSPVARSIGAVNTIAHQDGRLVGHNTDADGFALALRAAHFDAAGRRAVILGAGGAARAVAAGLSGAGAASIAIGSRTQERARSVVGELAAVLPGPRWTTTGWPPDLEDVDLLVNCTPAGMAGVAGGEELAEGLALDRLSPSAVVADVVYRPRLTPLLARARSRRLATLDGLPMLLHQGALAFTIWTGRDPPLEPMRAALEACL